jgi:hypothetical protein
MDRADGPLRDVDPDEYCTFRIAPLRQLSAHSEELVQLSPVLGQRWSWVQVISAAATSLTRLSWAPMSKR